MTSANTKAPERHLDREDIAVWPNGTWATLNDVWNGEFDFMSDDYEVVSHDNYERLRHLGIGLE